MRTITLNTGQLLPVIGIGTWEMGGRETTNLHNRSSHIKSIRTAIDHGLMHIDTAEMYGDGEAERITGEAIATYNREKLFVTTKIWPTNLHPNQLRKSAYSSLKRLQTPYIDLLLIHAPNESIPIEQSIETMCALKEEGVIKSIGLSNFGLTELTSIEKLFPSQITVCQNEYSLQSIDHGLYTNGSHSEVIPFCSNHGITFVGWRPLGKGKLLSNPKRALLDLARKYHCTPAQVALSWCIHQAGTATVAKASSAIHIEENARAVNINLSEADYDLLTKLYKN